MTFWKVPNGLWVIVWPPPQLGGHLNWFFISFRFIQILLWKFDLLLIIFFFSSCSHVSFSMPVCGMVTCSQPGQVSRLRSGYTGYSVKSYVAVHIQGTHVGPGCVYRPCITGCTECVQLCSCTYSCTWMWSKGISCEEKLCCRQRLPPCITRPCTTVHCVPLYPPMHN